MPIPPLDALSAEAAVLDNATSLIALLGYIVSKVREVRRFRKDCQELTNTCIALTLTFLDNQSALQDTRLRGEFSLCLREVYFLVMECREWNIAHITFDVTVKHRFTSLKARLDDIQKVFGLEILMTLKGSSSETTDALRSLMSQMNEMRDAQEDDSRDRKEMLEKVRRLQDDVLESRREILSLRPLPQATLDIIQISEPSIRVSDESATGKPLRGTFNGCQVSFQEIINKEGISDGLPRVVKLYKEMTEVAQIQTLYGVVEKDGTLYAVMEDMTRHISLSDAVTTGMIAQLSRIQKLRIGYEIAATLSALHRSDILVKVLSDTTTHLETMPGGGTRAKLSGLSHARRIWEITTRDVQDVRFDAPETEAAGSRSRMSDVWGLGVLLHVVFLAELPFGKKANVEDKEEQNKIKILLQSGEAPFKRYPTPTPKEVELAQECLRSDPFLRPTASWLAEQIFEVLIRVGAKDIPQLAIPVTTPRPLIDAGEKASIDKLVEQIHRVERQAKAKKGGIQKFTRAQINPLIRAAEGTNPVYAFTVGQAYVRDLVELGDESSESLGLVSGKVQRAKLALPYLEIAEQQGHIGAIKELVLAHKVLAEHYHALLEMGSD